MSVPVIAIVGRPNVGKSTLFNHLTRSRNALVADFPGLTRDRHYGEGKMGEVPFLAIDTGGLGVEDSPVETMMGQQAWQAVDEADIILFLVDGRVGLVGADRDIAQKLRQIKNKKIFLVVNKTDGIQIEVAMADFYELGLSLPIPIAASHGRGVTLLIEKVLAEYIVPVEEIDPDLAVEEDETAAMPVETNIRVKHEDIKFAVVGRPNVGKSTLVNRMLGEERVIVFDEAGTTRDSIYIPFERREQKYTIIDTAGVRRRARVSETIEKFSVIKTLQSIKECNVAVLVLDAQTGVSEQDLHLLGFILEAGRSLVIAVNKWDGMESDAKEDIKKTLNYRLNFADFAPIHYISALHGSGVGTLFDLIQEVYQAATKILVTSHLNDILQHLVEKHPPPMVQGRRIKLRYAHSGGHNPPIIVIHGNQTEHVPESYKRYLMNAFRDALGLTGTPIRLEFKTSDNPFKDRRNTLTPRQMHSRARLKKIYKKIKK